MTILDRRRQLQQQIAQLPDDQLTQVEQYLAFLGFQKTVPSQSKVTQSPSTGASILASLEQAHTPPDSPLGDDILAQPPEDFAAKIALNLLSDEVLQVKICSNLLVLGMEKSWI